MFQDYSHNPYFSRWFSAIINEFMKNNIVYVTILILVDGFLQLHQRYQ